MKKIVILLCAILLAGPSLAFAQGKGTVSGRVQEKSSGNPAGFATVALVRNDSIVVAGTLADDQGRFSLEVQPGEYCLSVSLIGFRNYRHNVKISLSGLEVGTVVLEEDTKSIKEAVVQARLPRTELKGDAIVTNITGSVLEHEGNAQDVLAKVPGLISRNGELEVVGRGAPQYYINGRKLLDTGELRDLMSEDIRSIEVINTPGALYGADVKAVVKIRTVRRQGEGFSFALTSQARKYLRTKDFDPSWTVLDLNYRKGRVDLIGKLIYYDNHNYQFSDITGESFLKNKAFKQLMDMDVTTHNYGINGRLGLNWQINPNHSLGFQVERQTSLFGHQDIKTNADVFENEVLVDHLTAKNDYNQESSVMWNGNAYYNGKVNQLEIDFNTDFEVLTGNDVNHVEEASELEPRKFDTFLDKGTTMVASKLVLSHPVGKGKLSGGLEETYVDLWQSQKLSTDILPAADGRVKENTIAGFAQYSISWNVNTFVAGLRFEHVDFAYIDRLGDDDLSRIENNVFPSLSFSTKAGPVDLSASFSGKTKRPSYWRLSNDITYISRFSYQTGNPKLKSEKYLDLALNARWKWLTLSALYERVTDGIDTWAYPYDDQGIVLLKYVNLDKPIRVFNVFLTANPEVGCWHPQYTVSFRRQFLKLLVEDPREQLGYREMAYERPEFRLQLNNSFRFKHSWQLSLDYTFLSPTVYGAVALTRRINFLEFAVQKSFLKDDALTIRLSATDILNDGKEYIFIDRGSVLDNQINDSMKPAVVLRVSYRFNTAASKYKGTGAGQSAKERMN